MKLFIEEHVDFEPEEVNIEHTVVQNYCDEKTNVLIRHMIIDTDLEVGKLYDFDFENEKEERTLLVFKVLKKMDDNNYLLCEEYYGKIYSIRDKSLLVEDAWIICDVKQELGIDLNNYMC